MNEKVTPEHHAINQVLDLNVQYPIDKMIWRVNKDGFYDRVSIFIAGQVFETLPDLLPKNVKPKYSKYFVSEENQNEKLYWN